MIDATEHQTQRPQDKEDQKTVTLVKKSHTFKSMIIATKDKLIKYLSPSHQGKIHDYRLLKQLFDPKIHWFEKYHILVDLGYLGLGKDFKTKELSLPHKRRL